MIDLLLCSWSHRDPSTAQTAYIESMAIAVPFSLSVELGGTSTVNREPSTCRPCRMGGWAACFGSLVSLSIRFHSANARDTMRL